MDLGVELLIRPSGALAGAVDHDKSGLTPYGAIFCGFGLQATRCLTDNQTNAQRRAASVMNPPA